MSLTAIHTRHATIIQSDHAFFQTVRHLAQNGRFFTATFIKKDNTIRTMTVRTGVKAFLKAGAKKRNHNPSDHHNLIVFEVGSGCSPIPNQYRTIPVDRLLTFKQGDTFIERIW